MYSFEFSENAHTNKNIKIDLVGNIPQMGVGLFLHFRSLSNPGGLDKLRKCRCSTSHYLLIFFEINVN